MILNIIFKIFFKELNDADIRKKTTKNMNSTNKSLKSLYLLTEEIKIIKTELIKFKKKEKKAEKFQLYKNYANDFLNKSKLTALLFEYIIFNNMNWKSMIFSINHENIINVSKFNNRFLYSSKRRTQSKSKINIYKRFNEVYNKFSFINKQNNYFNFSQSASKNLSDRKISRNFYINEEKIWSSTNEFLCVKCDEIDFKNNEKHQCLLFLSWKKFYFKSIVFENFAQTSFVSYDYEQYDNNLKFYEHHIFYNMIKIRFENSANNVLISEFIVSFFDYFASIYESKSVSLNFFSNFLNDVFNMKSFYEKDSDFSKRSYIDDSFQFTQDTFQKNERMSQFSSSSERIIKKEKKRAEKKTKMTLLIDIFNDILDTYDKIILIRNILKEAKMNLTWINFLTWFSIICKKLKKVCIKIIKKRFSKFKFRQSNDQFMSSQ